jgi:hypothetical protein
MTTSRANAIPGGIQRHRFDLPMRLFAGEQVQGYAVTKWRDWLITPSCGVWFAVSTAHPTAIPKAFKCSLATVKAHLLNGSVVCNG